MLLSLALIQQAMPGALAPPASPPTSSADDVRVVGQRLKSWKGKVSTTIGITTCRTTVSTGDKEIDAIGCSALKMCWSEHRSRYSAALRAKNAVEAKQAGSVIGTCLVDRRDALIADLVERRHQAGAGA